MLAASAPRRIAALALAFVLLAGCGDKIPFFGSSGGVPQGPAILRTEGTAIDGAPGWTWIPFGDSVCTDAIADSTGRYSFGRSSTGLAISWGTSSDLVLFLQGGGACFDFVTCGGLAPLVDKTALAGPFGPTQFAQNIYAKYPSSWIRRENMPASIRDATFVFVPYCTGDVHGGDRVTTYPSLVPGYPSITWYHKGHANVLLFLSRLAPTFPSPGKLVIAGSSGGGFGTLANYTTFRDAWPSAKSYLIDDSGPPLIGDAIPPTTRQLWYLSWNLGASLDPWCPECFSDLSQGITEIVKRYPQDRVALLSHLQDAVIRGFFGTITVTPPSITPMSATTFESELRLLGTDRMDPATTAAKYFFTAGTAHPTLEDPTVITSPAPGLASWIDEMLSDSPSWVSASD
jgi:hypothetical protein